MFASPSGQTNMWLTMAHGILFDLDDTLLDRQGTLRQFLPGQYRRFTSLHHVPEATYVDRFMQLDRHGATPRLLLYKKLGEVLRLPIPAHRLHIDFLRYAWSDCLLKPGARTLLAHLRGDDWRIGCVTNGSTGYQMRKLISSGLYEYFDTVVIAEQEGLRKPDTEMFHIALRRMVCQAECCLFVGDNPRADISGAYQVGLRTVWLPSHHPWPENLDQSCIDYRIEQVEDVLGCCAKILAAG